MKARLLLFFVLLLLAPKVVQAQGFFYFVTNDTVTITGYNGTSLAMDIPDSTNGYPVTSIADNAFEFSGITSATIPNSITNIGNNVFYDCASLTSVTLGTNVASIGNTAFAYCTSLTGITLPNSVTNLGYDMFYDDTNLVSATLGTGMGFIPDGMFEYCYSLPNITIPGSVTNISLDAFYSCLHLTDATIPASVISIEQGAFGGCESFAAFNVNALNPVYSSVGGVLFDKGTNTLIEFPAGKGGAYTIPGSVTNLATEAFAGATILGSVTIPGSIASISFEAFSYCYDLTNVAIGNGVGTIVASAFQDCTSLRSVTIPNSVTNIGEGAFQAEPKLTAITVDALNPVYRSVGGVVFNTNLTTLVECPSGMLGTYAVPNSVSDIGPWAFDTCYFLTDISIPNTVTNIEGASFALCNGLTNIVVPNSVTEMYEDEGYGPFLECGGLVSATLGTGLTTVPAGVFADCSNLTSVTILGKVTAIETEAFVNDSSLTSFVVPSGVTSIQNLAFSGCYNLATVTIPATVTNFGYNAFNDCSGLIAAYFEGNPPALDITAFSGDYEATAYYVPGTTGWGPIYDVLPTAPSYIANPVILGQGSGLGVQNNEFGFNIAWATNASVVVEATTNLVHPVWTPVATNVLTGSTSYFSDPQWHNYRNRYYRINSQ